MDQAVEFVVPQDQAEHQFNDTASSVEILVHNFPGLAIGIHLFLLILFDTYHFFIMIISRSLSVK